jgi:hypothetical protein
MSNLLNLSEVDCIYLSYDEPNAEKNWADLLNKIPWAKRVHGVKGSDEAHKACARLSETPRFITVDGDNIVDPKFFELEIDLDKMANGDLKQLSWCGKNYINGLVYGNGGLKCWTKEFVLNMKTHEAAVDPRGQVDFCWEDEYTQMTGLYSMVYNNTTPLQAWRAGFREGVKLTLNDGLKVALKNPKKQLNSRNYQRLLIWSSIGADVDNGLFAIYGARQGIYMTNCTDWDHIQVRDFEYLNQMYADCVKYMENDQSLLKEKIKELGETIRLKLNMPVADLDEIQSRFFKDVWVNPPRLATTVREQDTDWDILEL